MKITIEEQKAAQDIEVTIVCVRADRRVLDIAARLRMLDRKVTGTADGCTRVLSAEDVLFIESVDKHTFIYTADTVLETGLRLYEMGGAPGGLRLPAHRERLHRQLPRDHRPQTRRQRQDHRHLGKR